MKQTKAVGIKRSNALSGNDCAFDLDRLLDVLARIELRRQERLRSQRAKRTQ